MDPAVGAQIVCRLVKVLDSTIHGNVTSVDRMEEQDCKLLCGLRLAGLGQRRLRTKQESKESHE